MYIYIYIYISTIEGGRNVSNEVETLGTDIE